MESATLAFEIWSGLGAPLLRLVLFVSLGLFVANIIESLDWTHMVARVASPLVRLGRLSDISGASFSMAFFSGIASNTMLAEAYDTGKLSRRELILANLFNSLPTYFLHMPTFFFITLSMIKSVAFVYVGLTLSAALLRTMAILIVGRFLLPPLPEGCVACRLPRKEKKNLRDILAKAWERFQKRIRNIILFTVPIYTLFYTMTRLGFFLAAEEMLARRASLLSWIHPEALGIVVFHIGAEFTAGLVAAGALLEAGTLASREIVLALLAGNVLSSPVRAIRHQFPYYAGIFNPRLAALLIVYNQSFRMFSIVLITMAYYLVT